MSGDAARLEALGDPDVRFVWRGFDLTIPRALEDWPLDLIRKGRYVDAIVTLLGDQTAPMPLFGDAVSLSVAMAEAVGVMPLPESKPPSPKVFGGAVFGAVPLLLMLLDNYEDDIASDLRTFRHIDYADRWRGGLTLRQIWVYIRRLPPNSALVLARNGGHEGWTKQSIILAQVWERISGQVYVGRPMTREEMAQREAEARANAKKMADLKGKEDYYSPEASRRRLEEWQAKKAAAAAGSAPAPAPSHTPEPPPAAVAALDKAVARRVREMSTPRKAG